VKLGDGPPVFKADFSMMNAEVIAAFALTGWLSSDQECWTASRAGPARRQASPTSIAPDFRHEIVRTQGYIHVLNM
jgi:hypothetical protein